MTLTCPACRKVNELHGAPSACARCAADLSHIRAVNIAAEQALREAAAALRQCDWPTALAAATRSWSLQHRAPAAGLAFLAAAASGRTGPACAWLDRANSLATPTRPAHPPLAGGWAVPVWADGRHPENPA